MSEFTDILDADFANMLNPTEFAETAVYDSAETAVYDSAETGESHALACIFSEPFETADLTPHDVNTNAPHIFFRRSDLPATKILAGDGVTVSGREWKVSSHEIDGLGGVRVYLHEEDA